MRAEIVSVAGVGEGPPVVYVPGVDGTGELMLGTARNLERRFRLVRLRYVCSRGEPLIGDGYGELAATIREVLAEADIGRALLLGESFGSSLSLRTALDHPELVLGLAIVNGFMKHRQPVRLALARAFAPLVPRYVYAFGRRVGTRLLFGPNRDVEAERRFVQLSGRHFDAGYRRRLAMIARVDLEERMPEISCPVALFASDHDRVVPSVKEARRMAALLPDATVEVLTAAGHVVLPFQPEAWVARLEALAGRANRPRGSASAP